MWRFRQQCITAEGAIEPAKKGQVEMRTALAALIISVALLPSALGYPSKQDSTPCAEGAAELDASDAFDAFCRACHNSQKLAKSYFAGTNSKTVAHREAELAAFLDRHSHCPHRHHEELAGWLRELSAMK